MNDLVEARQRRAEKATWLLQVVPFLRFIGLTGSLAYEMAKESSDIDFFIIVRKGRIWTCKLLVDWVLGLFGLLRKGFRPEQRAGKICPNRFVSDEYLLVNPQNRYHAQDYSQMLPLYDYKNVYDRFLKKNHWMEKFGYFPPRRAIGLIQSGGILSTIRAILEWILAGRLGERFEDWAREYQYKRMKKSIGKNNPKSGIYVDNNEIRIHTQPR